MTTPPVEWSAGVSDEAVEAARLAYSDACKDGRHLDGADRFRAALAAALPHLMHVTSRGTPWHDEPVF